MTTIVTRAGQITLDKELRDELGIEVGTPVDVGAVD
jgi:AbrB family looped-hinge helix DNA binding protein